MGLATEETANALIKKMLSGETSAETATEAISHMFFSFKTPLESEVQSIYRGPKKPKHR